jgi:hypothetical protein
MQRVAMVVSSARTETGNFRGALMDMAASPGGARAERKARRRGELPPLGPGGRQG